MKKIKDYLHLYLMADVLLEVKRKNDKDYIIGRMCEITRKSNHGDWVEVWFDNVITVTSNTWETSSSNCHWFFFGEDHIKPILRPLSDMTEDEKEKWDNMRLEDFEYSTELLAANETLYLLKQGFDLFGLIESGLAIDKTKKTN